jgi:hypothetical protein
MTAGSFTKPASQNCDLPGHRNIAKWHASSAFTFRYIIYVVYHSLRQIPAYL